MLSWNLTSVIDEVARQEPLVGAFLVGTGLVFILMGIRLSRMLMALSFGVVGFVLGASIPGPMEGRVAIGMVGALALGAASLWTARVSAGVLCGMLGAAVGSLFVGQLNLAPEVAWGVVAIFFVAAASFAFVSLNEVIALVTSVQGTLFFLGGFVILCSQNSLAWSHLRGLLVSNSVFAPFLLLAGTVIGFYTQTAELQKKQAGQSA